MTFGGPQPVPSAQLPTISVQARCLPARRFRWWPVALGLGVILGVAFAVTIPMVSGLAERALGYQTGDCVVVEPTAGGELHTRATGCGTDPSFTVAGFADQAGTCSPQGYERFRSPLADGVTGELCLVPNLVAGHCYRFGVAVGIWNVSDCVSAVPAVIKVEKRLDTDDARACSPRSQLPARVYPAPQRTYCLGLVG